MNIAFFKPFIDESEIELIKLALSDESVDMVGTLEKEIKEQSGAKHVISANNGTAAKHLGLCAMDIKRGDKIICAVNAFVSVPEVIRYFDAEPIFVDIDKDDFTIDPNALEDAIKANASKKLKAVFVTHLAGQSADMKAIRGLCEKYGLKLINDSAIGVTYENELIGKDDYISCFGIQHRNQNSVVSAGFLLTNDDEIAARARLFRSHAMAAKKSDDLGYIYDVEYIGQRYDLNALCAAFTLSQIRKFDKIINARKALAKRYNELFKNVAHITAPLAKRDHIYAQYIIKVDKNRDGFAKELIENGVNVGLHYIPLHLLTYYRKKYNYRITDFPNALQAYSQVLSLPIYAGLSNEQVEYIVKVVQRIASGRV